MAHKFKSRLYLSQKTRKPSAQKSRSESKKGREAKAPYNAAKTCPDVSLKLTAFKRQYKSIGDIAGRGQKK